MNLLIYTNSLLFTFLTLLHIYWAFGGRWGYSSAIPTTNQGKPIFQPGRIACLLVAFGLIGFFLITVSVKIPGVPARLQALHPLALTLIGIVFGLRAIGDKNYVGLFRKLSETEFGQMDKKLFTPLCLYLSISSAILAFFS